MKALAGLAAAILGAALWVLAFGVFGAMVAAQVPDRPAVECSVELERLRAYASILKGDRDQKEAALADYGQQIRALTAELAKLKEKP